MKPKLSAYASNVHSQFGEDGIIQKIFELIGTQSQVCVEFGAWDGFYLSNTANLWTQGWRGILIEADEEKYRSLIERTKAYGCHCICARVGFQGEARLERILENHGLRDPLDLLSIDVDGDEYYILETMEALAPRVLICEYNPTIPLPLDLRQEPGGYFGCSATALVRLAEQKGYRLVAMTDCNGIFVRTEDHLRFAEFETALGAIMPTHNLTYLISGYGGACVASRQPTYGWTGPLREPVVGEWTPFQVYPAASETVQDQQLSADPAQCRASAGSSWWQRVFARRSR